MSGPGGATVPKLIWHSRELVNWKPVAAALLKYYGVVWAPYLCEYQGQFYIYYPSNGGLHVVHAAHPEGPWSEPIELGIDAIDPAHIAENGRRFLHMAGGRMAELTADGLAVKVPPRKVFEAYMSPGSVTEKLHFFVAEYQVEDRIEAGGGLADEGEDIEVIEIPLAEALAGMGSGLIQDAKTVMLLQHVALSQFTDIA